LAESKPIIDTIGAAKSFLRHGKTISAIRETIRQQKDQPGRAGAGKHGLSLGQRIIPGNFVAV
jgi:hypothetical protein